MPTRSRTLSHAEISEGLAAIGREIRPAPSHPAPVVRAPSRLGISIEPPDCTPHQAPDPEIDTRCPDCGRNTIPSYVWCGPCTAAREAEELPAGGADHAEMMRDADREDEAFREDFRYLGDDPI